MRKVTDEERGRAGMLRHDMELPALADGEYSLTEAERRPDYANGARRVVAGVRGHRRDRASCVSALSATAALVVALAACSAVGGSNSTPSTAAASTEPSSAVTGGPPAGQFTDLRDGAKVTRQQPVSGVATGIPSGDKAWIVIYPVLAPAYWPQKGPLLLDSAGGFRATAVFGSTATQNIGEHFVVRLVITSAAATARFRSFLADPSHGLSKLPAGARTLTRVTVIRD